LRSFLRFASALIRIPIWLTKPASERRRHEQLFFAALTRAFGIRIAAHGQPSAQPATLFIVNHISWADIPVTLALLDADFVAKSDMLNWPLIGWLARELNPVFVARDQRLGSIDQVEAIRTRLRAGRSIILCPEGTTSVGSTILPFRTSLLAAADAAEVVQPVVITYLAPSGSALSADRQREVAWIDDDELTTGLVRFAREKTLARVDFVAPVQPGTDRKRLAELVRSQMLLVQAAALNRSR
jgi:1-acyl-sn-glycerol-3-phosphate acyltransferase